jgi:hypothetical protein
VSFLQTLIFPTSVPNGANVIFPAFRGKIIGGQVKMNILSGISISGSPRLLGTFYPVGGFAYVRMIKMSLNQVTFSMTDQLAIFVENPDYYVDGSFPLELNITQDQNVTTAFWEVESSPGKNTFLVVEQ